MSVTLCAFLRAAIVLCRTVLLSLFVLSAEAYAGGPRYVAGVTYFNAGAFGQPLHWAGGQLNYYVDQGPLSSTVNNVQAVAMVDAAAALWSAVPTAGVTLTDMGPLNEDMSGANIVANGTNFTVTNEQTEQLVQISQPADVTPLAAQYPVGVIFDADGSVINALFGPGASDPTSCEFNGVWFWMDNVNADATIAHAILLLNGRCATNANMLAMMSFELERAFGHILNLDYAQVNPGALENEEAGGTQGWPVMQPISGVCGAMGGNCIPMPAVLHSDDIAALNRLYPITAANLASFPGKQLTAANTVSIQGSVTFATGMGMQGVNVVARPLDAGGNPLYAYTVTAVSGVVFNGNHGNPITGWTDSNGNLLTMWGSNDSTEQGFFDLSGIPLPPGVTTANYQVTLEAIDPLYILTNSVGPYLDGQVEPSGTLASISVPAMSAGSAQTLAVSLANSAMDGSQDAIGTQAAPRPLPVNGFWCGRLSQVGQSDWFSFPVRGNRTFTIVTQALDETGASSESKAMPTLGVWDAFDPVGATALGAAPGLNGYAVGETQLQYTSPRDDVVRVGIADLRGDGRPDYLYNGWVLYADSVQPSHLPVTGGPFVIEGMGFRAADTVQVGGRQAVITSISPNEITAIAPAAAGGITGSVDVEVDDLPTFSAAAIVSSGISYDAGNGDALTLLTAPMNAVPIGVPIPFTVTALTAALAPASGVTVVYTVTGGTATLACGLPSCSVTATGDGRAAMNVTALDGTWSIVTASLVNGSSLQAQFAGGTPPALASLTPQLSLAAGATISWTVQALVLSGGLPAAGQTVSWQQASGITVQGSGSAVTNASGIAAQTLIAGPLSEGQTATINACVNGTNQCVQYTVFGARPELATLEAVSGVQQSLPLQSTPSQITLRLLDTDGNPMAGGSVTLYQALYAWTPPCAAHTTCPPSTLLASQAGTATSALDGTVAFNAATLPGVATNLLGLAASGSSSSLNIAIEEYP